MNKIIILILFLLPAAVFTQPKEVVIESVKINGEPPENIFDNKIIISEDDSILFEYKLTPALDSSFLFRTILSTEKGDSSVKTLNSPSIRFVNLPEADYTFEISAFDGEGNWVAEQDKIQFIVDNELHSLLLKNENLETKVNLLEGKIKSFESENDLVSQISDITLIILIVLVVIVLLIYIFTKRKSAIHRDIKKRGNTVEKVKELEKENHRVKKELKALRSQIDKLQKRSKELFVQNRDLQDKINQTDQAHQKLSELQKRKEELFAIVIHDIKNPANVIKSLVDLLKNYDSNAKDYNDIMNDIISTSQKILSLSHEVSKIMALESSEMNMDFENTDINVIAQDIFVRNSYRARDKEQTYEFIPGENLPEVELDIYKIDEVMDNLISNAIKYTQVGGSILIETNYDDEKESVVFSVSDTGQGLSEHDIKKAFQRGATLSSKPTGEGESSTGLGLWIVKKMIEAHGGNVWVKSKKNEGSTFAFSLPLKQSQDSGKVKNQDKVKENDS